ncbi:hypothetical protein A943_08030 [Bacillus sp. CPSM8]|nr:hypothetical protein A943_08030 [Bacillus sp. CPSM8]
MYQTRIVLAIIFFGLAAGRMLYEDIVVGVLNLTCGVLLLETARLYKLLEAE